MPGTNAGTGCPLHFRCAKCRRAHGTNEYFGSSATRHLGSRLRVELTGRKKDVPTNRNARMSHQSREYRCLDCGHVGWSRHAQLEDKEKAEVVR